jgi:hypothetical protein
MRLLDRRGRVVVQIVGAPVRQRLSTVSILFLSMYIQFLSPGFKNGMQIP